MNLKQAINQPLSAVARGARNLLQPSNQSRELLDALNQLQGVSFDTLNDFFTYYKQSYTSTAYLQLTPLVCHQLAVLNPWIESAIRAITDPISTAEWTATPRDPTEPDQVEIDYLSWLMNNPNPFQDTQTLTELLVRDKLATGSAYLELVPNSYGFPAAIYRVPPQKVEPKQVGDRIRYVRSNGYVFPDEYFLPLNRPNPFSDYKGLSPLVSLFSKLMLDEAVTEHNLRYFVKDVLKGLLSFSDKVNYADTEKELERIQTQVKDMQENGESGHLVTYGVTFQSLASNNKDMMTPEVESRIIDAIKAVYRVPPAKIMLIESGNLGGGTSEGQDETLNDTVLTESRKLIIPLQNRLSTLAGITNTTLSLKNLTKKNEYRESEVDTINLQNGSTTLNEVRTRRGLERYEDWRADQPLIPANLLPLSIVGSQGFAAELNLDQSPVNQSQTLKQVDKLIHEEGADGAFIVRSIMNEI